MRKRLIALLLSLMMTLVLLPASFAEEDPAAENPEPAESLEPAEGLRAGNVSIDSTNFPDDNFRNYVQYDLLHADPSYFTPAEIADITVINCGYRLIENLQGIELFTSLETLICQDNRLMDIDVSAMPSLKKLDCHSNPLSGTIQIHVNLEELECWNSQIDGTRILIPRNSRLRVVKVDASGFSDLSFLYGLDLETLDCAYIDFESLDFTPWNNLHDLRCDNCNLSRLNVSGLLNLTRIRANDNNLTELDVSIVPALEELYVNNNHIAALDLSACPNLWGAELNQTADGLMTEDSGHYLFDLTSIGVADASKVTISDTDWTLDSVTGVATYNGSGIPNQLDYTYDTGNAAFPMQVTVTLGVAVTVDPNDFDPGFFNWLLNKGIVNDSGNGVYTISSAVTELDCSYEGLTSLKGIGYFQNLERLNCQDNELDSIDVSGMPSLKVLDCHSNPLSGTIAFHENLEELECWNSQIEGSRVLIPANSNLRVIKVDASEFGSLSVLNGLALETLDCPYHDYGTLDFTAWPTLRDFRCDSCNLTSLTVAGLANLTRICANANDLTEIDLTGLTSLEELYINDNHIAELDLPAGVTLDSAELDQRIKGQMLTDNGDGTYSFDLSALVTNLGNVTVQTAGATLSNGVVTFTSQPSELVYTYDIGDANFPMQVTVELGVAVTVQPSDFDPDFWNWLVSVGVIVDNSGVYTVSSGLTELDCGYQGLTSLRGIETFTSLERLNCQDNELDSIDVSGMPSLKVLDCHSNPLSGTIAFHENLEELECWNSQIEGSRVLIPANSNLRVIKVDASEFGSLSVLNGLALETLDCPYHDYGTLDFTAWPTLRDFRCDSCNLTSLTVAGLANLTRICANANDLTEIDLTGLTSLEELYINDNHIAELDLPAGVTLDSAELDQRIKGQMLTDNGDGTYSFDLSALVTNLGNVTVQTAGATLSNGVVTFTSQPSELVYTYDIGDANFPMQVIVELGLPANAPTVAVKTLSLSGQIGVNFYMDLSCLSEEEKEDSYMEFTINGRTERADFDPSFTNPSKGVYYGFTCHIASIEMADEITAEFHYGDDKTVGTTYTAQAYIQGALESPDYPQDAKALVKATADYGHYVQAYLKEVKNWPDDEHVTIKAGSEIGEAEIAAAAAAAAATEDWSVTVNVPEGAFVRSLGYSLMLDDMVTLILSVRTESGHALSSARIGEETLPIEGGAGGRYRVRIENIMAHQLGNRYTIVLNAGGEDAEITVSPMSYVKTLLTASAYENNMTAKQAAAAIYQYYQAAIAYIDARKAH